MESRNIDQILVYSAPKAVELGEAAVLTEGCNLNGTLEMDCGRKKSDDKNTGCSF